MKNLTINVGDYVRTKYGYIAKFIGIDDGFYNFDNIVMDESGGVREEIFCDIMLKSSPSIIDLIEVGDYVNGEKIIKTSIDHCGRKVLIYGYDNGDRQIAITIYEEDIKSIATKENMEAMEYKIER